MAPDQQTEDEPSIEEILDSIRQIISDEDEVEEAPLESDLDLSVTQDTVIEPAEEDDAATSIEVSEAPADDFDAMVAEAAAAQEETETQSADSVEEDAPEPEPVADEEEIIDLTQKVDAPADTVAEPDPTPEESAEEPAPENIEDAAMTDDPVDDIDALLSENPDDAAMQVDMEEGDGVPEPTAPAATAESVTDAELAAAAASGDDGIMTETAAGAALGAISALAQKAAVERAGNVTIEDIVREEMRPILRVWLDKNLPDIIERLMSKELERIAKDVQS